MGAEAWFGGGEKFAEGHRAVPFYMSRSHTRAEDDLYRAEGLNFN
jgi:hypothetical protein